MPSVLSPNELRTLQLICTTLLPDDQPTWRASVAERAAQALGRLPNADDVMQLRLLLTLLKNPAATLVLGGQTKRFSQMSPAERELFLRNLSRHPIGLIRTGFQAFKRLCAVIYYGEKARL
jgi:hypothetical protein